MLNSHNNHRDESIIGDGDHLSTIQDDTTTTLADVRIPIVGYEVMDERARFTVSIVLRPFLFLQVLVMVMVIQLVFLVYFAGFQIKN